jgi:hypothetical protein
MPKEFSSEPNQRRNQLKYTVISKLQSLKSKFEAFHEEFVQKYSESLNYPGFNEFRMEYLNKLYMLCVNL